MADALRVHRVDPRLVHATLLEAWLPYLGAGCLVVADAGVAADPRRRIIFEMSARDVERVYFVSEAEVAAKLAEVPLDIPTIIVYGSLEGVTKALDGGLECPRLLLGHLPDEEGRRRVHPSVYLGPADLAAIERIRSRGVDVVVRPLPSDAPLRIRCGEDHRPVLTDDLQPIVPPPSASQSEALAETEGSPNEPLHEAPAPRSENRRDGRREGRVRVINERGLHLRAAHVLAQRAGRFASSVQVGWPGHLINGKSLLGITTLGAARGSELELMVEGADADEAFAAIEALFAAGFEEGTE